MTKTRESKWVSPPLVYGDYYHPQIEDTDTYAVKNSRRAKMELDKKRKRLRDDEDYDT